MRAIKFFLTAAIIALATLPVTAPQTARGQNQYVLLDPGHEGTDPYKIVVLRLSVPGG